MSENPPTTEADQDPWAVTEMDHERGYKEVKCESKSGRKVTLRIIALPADKFLEICWTLPEFKVGIEVLKGSLPEETRDWVGSLCPFSYGKAMGVAMALARGDSAEKKRMETQAQQLRSECSKVIGELSSRFQGLASTADTGLSPSSSAGSAPRKE